MLPCVALCTLMAFCSSKMALDEVAVAPVTALMAVLALASTSPK